MLHLLLRHGVVDLPTQVDEFKAWVRSRFPEQAALIANVREVRAAGGWDAFVRVPRKRVLALRVLCEQGRASTDDALLRRLFPAAPPAAAGVKRARADYLAAKGGRLPRGIFWLVLEFWRCDRDSGPARALGLC